MIKTPLTPGAAAIARHRKGGFTGYPAPKPVPPINQRQLANTIPAQPPNTIPSPGAPAAPPAAPVATATGGIAPRRGVPKQRR